jgi:ketosteroid isomerase-like protein
VADLTFLSVSPRVGTATGRAKKTGKTVKSEWAHVFKYKQGKVVLFQEYTDTTADVLAMS